jgi:hypothetical protein
MIDVQKCIPPEDDPGIGLKHLLGKNKNTINTKYCVYGIIRMIGSRSQWPRGLRHEMSSPA